MVASNMNAIRVWGGGVYESDTFYALADEYGILIWHDFMFAVALYPAHADFLQSVDVEVRQQVDRLKTHPCILVWAANNENELGLLSGWFNTLGRRAPIATYKADYMRLYNETIWRAVNETDRTGRPFLLSSPSGGVLTVRNGGFAPDPNTFVYGDVHYYNYLADSWNASILPIARCVTEFGVQSLPSVDTLTQALPNITLSYFGAPLLHRQHHALGNVQMLAQILVHFRFPTCIVRKWRPADEPSLYPKHDLTRWQSNMTDMRDVTGTQFVDRLSYLSQVHQARAYQTQVEHYRSYRNRTTPDGHGQTMCALYWQLNDIWHTRAVSGSSFTSLILMHMLPQAPTWSSIDYNQQWKIAHYFARHFFAPVVLSLSVDTAVRTLTAVLLSDLPTPIHNATLTIDMLAWTAGFDVIYTHTTQPLPVVPAQTSRIVWSAAQHMPTHMTQPEDFIYRARLNHATIACAETTFLPDFLLRLDPNVFGRVHVAGVTQKNVHTFAIELHATAVAPYCWLEAPNVRGWFSDNGFTMTRPTHTIDYNAWSGDEPVSLQQFTNALTVRTLADVYAC